MGPEFHCFVMLLISYYKYVYRACRFSFQRKSKRFRDYAEFYSSALADEPTMLILL